MLKDFREFITRGSVIDLAIGVIIGAAFTAIVNSLVDDMFMPIIGVLLGGVSFESLSFQVGDASINYGMFTQSVINFFLIALVIFFGMRAVLAVEKEIKGKEESPMDDVPEIPQEVQLLTEIRDLMKEDSTAV